MKRIVFWFRNDLRLHDQLILKQLEDREDVNLLPVFCFDERWFAKLKTGFMSNRGRQNVASYLCKDLSIDWRWGAGWFESQLIDYDVATNWGNWMYIAGVGNDPRENRYFNVEKQAEIYDADKSYRKTWLY